MSEIEAQFGYKIRPALMPQEDLSASDKVKVLTSDDFDLSEVGI